MITSGLNKNFTLSPSYSFRKSSYHKSCFFAYLCITRCCAFVFICVHTCVCVCVCIFFFLISVQGREKDSTEIDASHLSVSALSLVNLSSEYLQSHTFEIVFFWGFVTGTLLSCTVYWMVLSLIITEKWLTLHTVSCYMWKYTCWNGFENKCT